MGTFKIVLFPGVQDFPYMHYNIDHVVHDFGQWIHPESVNKLN